MSDHGKFNRGGYIPVPGDPDCPHPDIVWARPSVGACGACGAVMTRLAPDECVIPMSGEPRCARDHEHSTDLPHLLGQMRAARAAIRGRLSCPHERVAGVCVHCGRP